jgi:hypothetical protein
MDMLNMKEVAEEMMKTMRKIIEDGEDALPILARFNIKNEMEIIGIEGMLGEEEKDKAALLIQQLVDHPETSCLIQLSDAYIKTFDLGDQIKTRLKNEPGRREAIVATISGRGLLTSGATWVYDRDSQGKPSFTEKPIWSTDPQTGRFVPETRAVNN